MCPKGHSGYNLEFKSLSPIGSPVSKQDTHFFNTFSMVIGLLIVVALMIFALARIVGDRTQLRDAYADPKFAASTEERVRPFVRVAVAGRNKPAPQNEAAPPGAGVA